MTKWNGSQVLVLGAARQGVALARWLSAHGASVTLNDKRNDSQLAAQKQQLRDVKIRWISGSHPLELLENTDYICISGGVPLELPIVQAAINRGIPLTNDTQIFLEQAPCKTVGITGSAGKTTTTALVGAMAELWSHARGNRVFTGGNIGDPLLNYLDTMQAEDVAILEISSFQLEQMTTSTDIAAILNITPNHLDRHHTMEAYIAAKARLLDFQRDDSIAVLGRDDEGAWNLRDRVHGQLMSFGMERMGLQEDGAYMDDGMLYLADRGVPIPLLRSKALHLRGVHNARNVLAAFAIGHAAGFSIDAMLSAAEEFRGVAHRLEFVRMLHGASWYDDSIATTPERVIAAVNAFEEPLVLLLGGRDKDLPWETLADLVHQKVRNVIVFGEAANKIETSLRGRAPSGGARIEIVKNLQQAVLAAAARTQPGDVVLLSPGGTSFDEFKDFEERGASFRSWVNQLF